MDLAKKQFDYYARVLGSGNPYSAKPDDDAVDRTRVYLSGFKGIQRAYKGLLDNVSKKGKPKDFNHEFAGTADTARVIPL